MNNRISSSSPDLTQENIKKLKEIFPEIVTEDKIDFDMLQTVLGEEIANQSERYRFEWHGKREALLGAQQPSKGTLRPDKEASKNFNKTENLYIEGDNLEVLKLLQKSYNNKVKVIYIDPPYNTGNDFIYRDNFKDNIGNYYKLTGQVDSEGRKLSTNTENSGRYHTEWLNMMYPRLRLSRSLLTDDGVIFISIDDTEQEKLKMLCNEIFGEQNFIAQLIWERAYSPINLKKNFSENHDFILVYAKDASKVVSNGLKRSAEADKRYMNPDNDIRGLWKSSDLSVGPAIEKNIYEITTPSGRKVMPPSGYSWRLSEDKLNQFIQDNRIWFGLDGNNVPSIKRFLSEVKNTVTPMTIWKYSDVGHSQSASQGLKKMFNDKSFFSYPKPVELLKRILELYSKQDSLILDFFSGSATMAHAVMELNATDGGNRKFIMVQLPEKTDEGSEAYKGGFKTICEIGQERIRRAGKKILDEYLIDEKQLDVGFKVLKLESSNIREWNMNFEALQSNLIDFENIIIPNRSELDVVYEIMLKYGLELTYSIETFEVEGKNIYDIAFGNLFICLDKNIDCSVAKAIIDRRMEYEVETSSVIFADHGFNGKDSDKLNCFKLLQDAGYQEEQIMTI